MPKRLMDARIDELLAWIASVSTKQTIIDTGSIRSLLEEVRERRKADKVPYAECLCVPQDPNWKCLHCLAIARAEKEGKNR